MKTSTGETLDTSVTTGGDVLRQELDGWRSGWSKVNEGDGFGGVICDGEGMTGRGRGRKGRPSGVGSGEARKSTGSGRNGGHVGDDWVGVGIRDGRGCA